MKEAYASLFHMPRGPRQVLDYGLALYSPNGTAVALEGTDYLQAERLSKGIPNGGPVKRPSSRTDGSVGIFFDRWIANYYHWMVFCVPKVILLNEYLGITRFFAPSDLSAIPSFVFQTLELLGLSEEALIPISQGFHQASELCFVQGAGPSALTCQLTRRKLLQADPQGSARARRRVFLRRNAQVHAQRSLVNEAEILSLCAAQGIEVVDPGELPLKEQIRLFQDVRVVIALHGAALANMLWMRPDSTVIEIATGSQPHYRALAENIGINWFSLAARKLDQRASGHNGEFVVNTMILQKLIENHA